MYAGLFSLLMFAAALSVNGEDLFVNIAGVGSTSIPQCAELQVAYGGGTPPYTLSVWSYQLQQYTKQFRTNEPGTVIWSVQYSPTTWVRIFIQDNVQASAKTPYYQAEASQNTTCYDSTANPEFREAPDVQATLADCKTGGQASCSFAPQGSVGIHPQRVLIGNPFSNCASKESVTHEIGGSTTITDNWSITVGTTFGIPIASAELSVTVEHSKAVTLSQTIQYEIKPGVQSALVGITDFEGTTGTVTLKYPNNTSVNVSNIVYFKNAGGVPTFQRLDIACDEKWPAWNATATTELPTSSNAAIMTYGRISRAIYAAPFLALTFALY